jgi:hypothetical protein
LCFGWGLCGGSGSGAGLCPPPPPRPPRLSALPCALPCPAPQVLAAQENDGNKVVKEQILGPRTKQVGQRARAAWLLSRA